MTQAMPLCAGAASLYLLQDTDAVDAFRDAIGAEHRVAPGSVRTFLPDVDPAWAADGPRHRFVTAARMTDPKDRAWHAISANLQRASTAAPLPQALRGLVFPTIEQAHREQRHAALTAVRDSAEVATLRQDVAEFRDLLDIADQDLREAAVDAQLAAETATALEHELEAAREQAAAADEDAVWALGEAERAITELEAMRARLYATGRHEDAAPQDPVLAPAAPASFEQLWARTADLPGIRVTAERATALGLDEHERARVWAAKAWQGLRALDAYASAVAAGFDRGFFAYCRSEHAAGAGWSANQLAMSETGATMDQWGHQRIFPVPIEVDEHGVAQMQAHLKLDSKGATSPRIHFLDDTKGVTGQVIVGYIGPHLTNTRTN